MLLSIFSSSGGHYPKSDQSAEFSYQVAWDAVVPKQREEGAGRKDKED